MNTIYEKFDLFGKRLQLDLFGEIESEKSEHETNEIEVYEYIPKNLFDTQLYISF